MDTTFGFDQNTGLRVGRTLPKDHDDDPDVAEHETYDALGRPKLHADFKGQVTQFVYDDDASLPTPQRTYLGNLVQKRLYGNMGAYSAGTATETISYEYDDLGRQISVSDQVGSTMQTTSFTYDGEGRQVVVTSPEGIIHYQYDPATGQHTRTWTNVGESEKIDISGAITDGALVISGTRADASQHEAFVKWNASLSELQHRYDDVFGENVAVVGAGGTVAHHTVTFSDAARARAVEPSVRINIFGLLGATSAAVVRQAVSDTLYEYDGLGRIFSVSVASEMGTPTTGGTTVLDCAGVHMLEFSHPTTIYAMTSGQSEAGQVSQRNRDGLQLRLAESVDRRHHQARQHHPLRAALQPGLRRPEN